MTIIKIDKYQRFRSNLNKDFKIVTLDCAYDTIDSKLTQTIKGKIDNFKIQSYIKEYQYGVLPVDSFDLPAIHLVLCQVENENLKPVMGFKAISLTRCKAFNLSFPALHVVDQPQSSLHKRALKEMITEHENNNRELGYIGSWAIHPDVRKNRQIVKLCYDLSTVFTEKCCSYYHFKTVITFAALRFRVEKLHKFIGMSRFQYQGKDLPSFQIKTFFEEPVSLSVLDAKNVSPESKALSDSYQQMWENRLDISKNTIESVVKEAA